jgi:hypothetical protein
MRLDQQVHVRGDHAQRNHVTAFLPRDGAQIAFEERSRRRIQEGPTSPRGPDEVEEQA